MREILEDSIQRLLQEQVNPDLLRRAESGHWCAELWALLEEGGFTLALVREQAGGSGIGWSDIYSVLAAAGEHALPLPLPETLLAAWLLDQANLPVPEGPISFADPGEAALPEARRDGDQWRIDGRASLVPWGRDVPHLLLAVQAEGTMQLALVQSRHTEWQHDVNLAREPRDSWAMEGTPALHVVPWPDDGAGALGLRQHGAMLRSAQMAGAMRRILKQSAGYANERVQFGRAIGQFQAIQQQLAVLACHAAAATAGAAFAFEQAGGAGATLAVAAAKTRLGESAGEASGIAHATHGAIGFTYEHTLHFATRRLWSWRSEFGQLGWWSQRIGAAVRQSAEPVWHTVVRGELALARRPEKT